MIPWMTERTIQLTFNTIQNTTADILMGHLDIKGVRMNKREVSNDGRMDNSMFTRFDLVFSGHFHHKSSVGNIHYLGAFSEHDWNDHKDPRGFTIFDLDTRQFEFIENPHILHKAVYYDDAGNNNILKEIQERDYSEYKDCIIKVVCKTRENMYAYETFLDLLHKANPVVVNTEHDVKFILGEEVIREEESAQDTPSILDSYIKSLSLPVDNDKMSEYMKNLYHDAISNTHIRN